MVIPAEAGADVDKAEEDADGATPLYVAGKEGHTEIVTVLLRELIYVYRRFTKLGTYM